MRQTGETVSPKSNEGRNRYVIEHITAALIDLMEKYPFEEISVSQICQEAQVGRASFYRNYESKKDILEKHMDTLIHEWGKEFEERGEPSYFSESLLKHYYKYKDFYLLLYRHGLSDMIYETIRSALKITEAPSNLERYGKSMFAGMLFGWIDEWMRQGMPEKPEEIILLTSQVNTNEKK